MDRVLSIVGDAACLIMPSVSYETFGRTIVEAFAKGTPVVASRLGAMSELVKDGLTGALFEPGDADDLILKVRQLMANRDALATMRKVARREYEQNYTARANYEQLMQIYEQAISRHATKQHQTGRTRASKAPSQLTRERKT